MERVTITCKVCGARMKYLPSFLKVHPIKYCSKKCEGVDRDMKVEISCDVCKRGFKRRRDKIKGINYCSKLCSAKGRSVEGAKWRDPNQIKAYMKEYSAKNRKRLNELANERVKKNKSKRHETQAKYRKNNRHKIAVIYADRKGATLIGDLTPEQWEQVIEKYNHTCLCCGKREPEIKITLDHIIPLSRGGSHTKENVQPLCKSCNSRKNTKTIDFREKAA